ncbi:MAG: LysM peptidoglycan-binding domain-containing protein [Deltaproteobacteria bacterium]|nr:LysM peptidoglycan-binding domain-containing protein [Deltaproteobacteria bacterium]
MQRLLLILLIFLFSACSSVSEEEKEKLRAETEALAAELGQLRQEAVILDRALTNVYKEKDRVVDQINNLSGAGGAQPQNLAGMPIGGPAAIAQDSLPGGASDGQTGPRKYIAQRGDTLSQLAKDNNTTVQAIVQLNPFLNNREGYMVWERDELLLP